MLRRRKTGYTLFNRLPTSSLLVGRECSELEGFLVRPTVFTRIALSCIHVLIQAALSLLRFFSLDVADKSYFSLLLVTRLKH